MAIMKTENNHIDISLENICSIIKSINTMCDIRQDEFTFPCNDCKVYARECLKDKLIEAISNGDYDKARAAYSAIK